MSSIVQGKDHRHDQRNVQRNDHRHDQRNVQRNDHRHDQRNVQRNDQRNDQRNQEGMIMEPFSVVGLPATNIVVDGNHHVAFRDGSENTNWLEVAGVVSTACLTSTACNPWWAHYCFRSAVAPHFNSVMLANGGGYCITQAVTTVALETCFNSKPNSQEMDRSLEMRGTLGDSLRKGALGGVYCAPWVGIAGNNIFAIAAKAANCSLPLLYLINGKLTVMIIAGWSGPAIALFCAQAVAQQNTGSCW